MKSETKNNPTLRNRLFQVVTGDRRNDRRSAFTQFLTARGSTDTQDKLAKYMKAQARSLKIEKQLS